MCVVKVKLEQFCTTLLLLHTYTCIRMAEDTTSIRVSEYPTWEFLHNKKRPGESMDDVLQRELDLEGEQEAEA